MNNNNLLVLSFPDYQSQARRLAEALECSYTDIDVHVFPDGERKVRVPECCAEHTVICRSLNDPDHKLIELLLAADAAREQGAQRLTLVAPYLAYMRQDIAFHPGEAVSQRIIGHELAQNFDDVITVDAHLHRITELAQAVPATHAVNLSAAEAIGEFLAGTLPKALLLGPDEESAQWVEAVAKEAGCDYAIARKLRNGDNDVEITLPQKNFRDRQIVLVDDMASTGRTLATAAGLLRDAGAKAVHCVVTHALFVNDAEQQLHAAGIEKIWSTDSVTHSSNRIALDTLLAEAVLHLD
jgi:ribose-phosphate pyrophosphokinase